MWDMNEYEGPTSKIRFVKDLPGINLAARGLAPVAEYRGYFYPTTPFPTVNGRLIRLNAVGYVFSNGQALFSADATDCGCWPWP
jgi:hypothetical protein